MRAKAMALAAAVVALMASDMLMAQDQGGPCPGMYPSPKVGEYADLRFKSADQGSMGMRFAIVGEEDVFGRRHIWVEIASVPPKVGDTVVVQMLVPGYPFQQGDLRGYVVKMPGQPAMSIPQDMLEQLGSTTPGPGWKEQCEVAVDLGNERVTVPAGTFIARHYRSPDEKEEVWIADVPFGMVKLVTADGEMELIAYGTDARSRITEEPIEYRPPQPPGGG